LSALLTGAPTTHDELVTRLVRPTRPSLFLTPGTHRVTPTRSAALTTTVGVVHRVHHDTAHVRALALPAHPAGLAPADVGLFGIAHGAHGGAAPGVHVADLARRHPQLGVRPFLGHQ